MRRAILTRGPFRKGIALLYMGALAVGLRAGGALFGIAGPTWGHHGGQHGVQRAELKYHLDKGGPERGVHVSSRHLLSLANCTPRAVEQFPRDVFSQDDRAAGWVLLHICVVAYMFLALALVCDGYFVPSLEVLCDLLRLQPDVAGATFMAAGSSAPELATAVIGVFVAKDDVGLSTVVGSAIYNVMFVVSVCGLAARGPIHLSWWPLVRDCLAYLVSILALIMVIVDEVIVWYESVMFIMLYVVYCVLMGYNRRLESTIVPAFSCCPVESRGGCGNECSGSLDYGATDYKKLTADEDQEDEDVHEIVVKKYGEGVMEEPSIDATGEMEASTEVHRTASEEDSIWRRPRGYWACLLWGAGLPISVLLVLSIPDCRKDSLRKWFWLTFTMSLVWLSVFSFLMVWMITIIGYTVDIPDSVMSLTFVAFGVSLPDVVASVLVIKDGLGDMAVSNAVGSNVFDILVCLGVPWAIQTCLRDPGSSVVVYSQGLTYSSMTLLSTVFILVLSIQLNRWRLDKRVALWFMFVYVAFSVLTSLYELNVFGYFHPEECPSTY